MICREIKICRISRKLIKGIKTASLRFKLHILALVVLSVLVSGYQSQKPLKNLKNEEHLEIFQAQYKYRINNNDSLNLNIKNFNLISYLYNTNGTLPVWTTNFSLNENAAHYMDILSHANYYGLDSNEYNIGLLRSLQNELNKSNVYLQLARKRVDFEIQMTNSCIRFATALRRGIFYERAFVHNSDSNDSKKLVSFLINCTGDNNFKKEFLSCQPKSTQYKFLQAGLEKFIASVNINKLYKNLTSINNNPLIPVEAAKEILVSLNYLKDKSNTEAFNEALILFQKNYKIAQSGMLDQLTRRALLNSVNERFLIAALNLERLRQEGMEQSDYLLVNIPSFNLKVYEHNQLVRTFKTIIGKPVSPTPVFSGKINKIVTNPSWFVPQSISSKEMLGKIKQDSSYLTRNKYIILDKTNNEIAASSIDWKNINEHNFNYRLVQTSNENNALGIVKFLFPNNYDVYVHDTPSKRLFNNEYRAYSHGCVRLQDPEKLAEYLIQKQQNTYYEKKLKKNLSNGTQEVFYLKNTVDIHLRYYTCEGDENGNLIFYQDIYSMDTELLKELKS